MGVADGENGGCACGNAPTPGGAHTDSQNGDGRQGVRDEVSSNGFNGGGAAGGTVPNTLPRKETAQAAALRGWLDALGLGAYEPTLVTHGFDTLETMSAVTESDLEEMGFKRGHLRLILAQAPSISASRATAGGGFRVSIPPPVASHPPLADPPHEGPTAATASPGSQKPGAAVDPCESSENGVSEPPKATRTTGSQGIFVGVHGSAQDEAGGPYTDAQALKPMQTYSMEKEDGKGGANGETAGKEGFKELKHEEVEVCEVVGEGSFGIVRRGRWRGMEVAVKELKVSHLSPTSSVSRESSKAEGAGGGVEELCLEGESEIRHEARMLAKVCNHVW